MTTTPLTAAEIAERIIKTQNTRAEDFVWMKDAATVARALLTAAEENGRLREALALAETIINRLPANGEHWSLMQRFGAALSIPPERDKSDG